MAPIEANAMDEQVNPEGQLAPVETEASETVTPPEGQEHTEAKPPEQTKEPQRDEEPKGVAKRLRELTDRAKAAEQREARLLALLEQGRQEPAKREAPAEQPKTLKDFNYDENAYRDHLYEKAAREVGKRLQAEQEAIQRRAKFDERVEAFAKRVDDYHDVVTDSTPVSEAMADAIMDSDEAGALMYYLGNNPDEARKLYFMSPAKAGRELQKLEDRLVAERKKASAKPVSQAPPPPPSLEAAEPGVSVSASSPDSDKLSAKEWLKRREKELAKRK